MVLARLGTGYSFFCRKGSFPSMSQNLTKRGTPEEREFSQKREEMSSLQTLLAQRELDLIPSRTTRLRKKNFFTTWKARRPCPHPSYEF